MYPNETKVIKDLHKIRESIYNETKKMSNKEYLEYSLKKSKEAIKRLGLKVKELSKV